MRRITMDGAVAAAPEQLPSVRVTERHGGGWVGHPDERVAVQDQYRLGDGGQRGGEYRPAGQRSAVSIGGLA